MKRNKLLYLAIMNANNPITFASGPTGARNFDYSAASGGNNSGGPANPMQQQASGTPGEQLTNNLGNEQQQQAAKPAQGSSPLDEFKGLFDTATVDPNAPKPKPTIFDLKPEQLTAAGEKIDISSVANADVVKSIIPNATPDQVKAFQGLMNSIARQVYVSGLQTSVEVAKQGRDMGVNMAQDTTLARVNTNQAASLIEAANPMLGHPAFKETANNVLKQVMAKNPNNTPKQNADLVIKYFSQINQNGATDPAKSSGEDKGIGDFFSFLDKK